MMVLKPSYPEKLLTQKSSGTWELFVKFGNRDLLLLFEYLKEMEKISSDFLSLHLSLCVPVKQHFYLY